MTIREALQGNIAIEEAQILLAHVLGVDRVFVMAHSQDVISRKHLRTYQRLVARREKQEPIAYLIGTKEFFGRRFIVNNHTLIPRPETETLVEHVLHDAPSVSLPEHLSSRLEEIQQTQRVVYWDVGTGSGCIGITLSAERPDAIVIASDVSKRALDVARQNQEQHHTSVTFVSANLLNPTIYEFLQRNATDHTTLHIVANLPYLPETDAQTMQPDVVQFEPSRALFAGTHGNDIIERFLRQLSRHAHEWPFAHLLIWLEIDPPQQSTLQTLIKKLFPHATTTTFPDLAGHERFIRVSLK